MQQQTENQNGPPGAGIDKTLAALEEVRKRRLALAEAEHASAAVYARAITETTRDMVACTDESRAEYRKTTASIAASLERLNKRMEVFEHNLSQIMLLCQAVAKNGERLSHEHIDRHVTQDFFRGYAEIYEALKQFGGKAGGIREWIWAFLDGHGVRLIEPAVGEDFVIGQHHVVATVASPSAGQAGKIRQVIKVGLANERRIIDPAKVEVYKR